MKLHLSSIAIVVLAAVSSAQSPSASPAPAAPDRALNQIAAGTLIPAALSKSLDAKKCKPGDKIEAKITMDLLAHGQIVIPRDSRIVGHVTDAKPHTKVSPDSMVGLAFDRIATKDGRELPMQAVVIQAIGRPLTSGSSDDPTGPGGIAPSPGSQPPDSRGTSGPIAAQNAPGMSGPNVGPQIVMPTMPAVSPLTPECQGAIGMTGIALSSSKDASVISSNNRNVHLDGGTQLMLRID